MSMFAPRDLDPPAPEAPGAGASEETGLGVALLLAHVGRYGLPNELDARLLARRARAVAADFYSWRKA